MGWEADLVADPAKAPALTTPAPKAPWERDLIDTGGTARVAQGAWESVKAGYQGSATGLMLRGRLPELVLDPEASKWWERALSGLTQVGAELPQMTAGALVGAPLGAAAGTPAGPVGVAAGGLLGAGAGMGVVAGGMREALIQAYKAGDVQNVGQFFDILKEVVKTAGREGGINAVSMGAGAAVGRVVGKALAPSIGARIGAPVEGSWSRTASGVLPAAQEGSDLLTQVATMVTVPAALEGRMPHMSEIVDASIVVGGLKGAHVAAGRIANSYARVGKTPAEVVADANRDPAIKEDLTAPQEAAPAPAGSPGEPLRVQEQIFRDVSRMDALEAIPEPSRDQTAELETLRARVAELESQVGDRPPSTIDDSLRQIYADVQRQMREAGRPDDEADAIARLERERYRARATRLGEDPWTLYSEGKPGGPRIAGPEEPRPDAPTMAKEGDAPRGKVPEIPLDATPSDVSVALSRHADEMQLRGNSKAWAEELPGLPRSIYAALSEADPADLGATQKRQLQELRRRVLAAREDPAQAMREVWGRELADAPPQLRRAIERDMALSGVPSGAARAGESKPLRSLDDPEIRELVGMMGEHEAGWETVGGKLDLARYVAEGGTLDADGRPEKLGIVAFTEWVPRAEWWRDRPGPGKLNERETRVAVRKALDGEKLTKREQRTVDYLTEVANRRAEAQVDMGAERWDAVSRELVDEHLDPTTRNVVDTDLVAKASEHNPDAVERAAMQFENDDAGFMNEVRRILDEPSDTPAAGRETGEPYFQSARGTARAAIEPENLPATVGGGGPAQGWTRATRISREGRPLAVHRGQRADLVPEHFGLEALGHNTEHPTSGLGVFFSNSKAVATKHGDVVQYYLDIRNPKVIKADEMQGFESVEAANAFREQLRKDGFDGIIISGKHLGDTRTDIVAFDPNQVIPLNQEPRILFQSSPKQQRFYSALGRQLGEVKQESATAEQWKGLIKNLKGVKKDEIEWSGLNEWLDLQQGKVTKQQVQDFLANNGVKVEEVILSDEPIAPAQQLFEVQDRIAREDFGFPFDELRDENKDLVTEAAEVEISGGRRKGSPKFSQYTLPGGENYRELLLTLPSDVKPEDRGTAYARDHSNDFQSSHFDEPNVLAHVRFNDRTDADGNRVLFIEEFQSDWAQQGKKHGFNEPAEDKYRVERGNQLEGGDQVWLVVNDATGETENFGRTREEAQRWADAHRRQSRTDGVPKAPFVTKTESWVGLAVKRMIAWAVENGYDKVSWTRGEQQVERYTGALRKAVDEIEWTKTDKGVQIVGYKGKSSGSLSTPEQAGLDFLTRAATERELTPAETERYLDLKEREQSRKGTRNKVVDTTEREDALSDSIGKAMADRILQDPAQSGTISGEGIRVDDTGMASFYDKIVVNVANDILKKLGGGKVGETTFDLPEGRGENRYDADQNTPPAQSKNPAIDITPEMREKVAGGQPLFQRQTGVDNRGSYTPSENLIRLLATADRSTAAHELGHSWLEEMSADALRENAPAQILRDWETIRNELSIPENGKISTASHEQWARMVERYLADGTAPSPELASVFARFKEWLIGIYHQLTEIGADISPDMREVLDRMLATDEQIAAARDMNIPRAYVDAAKAETGRKIVPGFVAEQVTMQPFADDLPKGPGQAPDNTHVNYKYINSPRDVQLTMQRMAELDQAKIQEQRGGPGGTKSWEQANAEQAKYINDVLGGAEDTLRIFMPRDPGQGPDIRLGILKKLAVGAAKDSARLRDIILEKGPDATVQEQLEYMGSIERARMIQAEFLGERAGVARALNALKDTTEGSGEIGRMLDAIGYGDTTLYQAAKSQAEAAAEMKAKLDEILLNYKGRTVYDIAKLHKEIGTLKGSFKFAKEVTQASTWEKVVEGWKSALLSGPVTHTTNLFGTSAFHALRPAVDTLAALIGMARGAKVGMGEGERQSLQEGIVRLTGWLGGVQDGLRVGYSTFKEGETSGKTESFRQAIPGRAGELVRIPLRMMSAEDAIVTTMYTRGEMRTLALRQAFSENIDPRTREFAERVEYLLDHPTSDMQAASEAEATRMTFNAPLGEKGRMLQLFVNKWNLQWMIPFIRTPINIAKEVARMSPFAPIVGEWRDAIAAGGVSRDRALAEMALGSGIMALTMAYAFDGKLSGSGDPDPGKKRAKADVWQPGSVLIGDTWYEIQRIQPLGTLMVAAADMAMVWDHMTEDEMDKVPKMLSVAFANAVTNQTFLQGITNVINAMSDPTRFFPRFAQQMAGSMVPNIIGQTTTMSDPLVREVNGMLDAIKARIPGMRGELLPKKDWLGENVETKERLGILSPVRMQQVSEDKVRQEADRLGISVAAAPKKIHIGKGTGKIGDVEITPEQRNKFAEVSGKVAHDALSQVVNGPGWDKLPDIAKRRVYARVLSVAHRAGAIAAFPVELREGAIQQITQKMQAELAPAP